MSTQTPRPHAATATPTASPDDHGGGTTEPTPTASASPDDHGGGDDNSGPGGGTATTTTDGTGFSLARTRERMAPMTEHPHRHDVWGDDPEEVDASAVVEELLADPGTAKRWHDHPSIVWVKAVGRFIGRNGKRVGITIAGFAVILAGIALLVLPGPGWLLIFAGLAILSTEYVWARRLLVKAKTKAEQAKDVVLRKKAAKAEKKAGPEDTSVPLPNDDLA